MRIGVVSDKINAGDFVFRVNVYFVLLIVDNMLIIECELF